MSDIAPDSQGYLRPHIYRIEPFIFVFLFLGGFTPLRALSQTTPVLGYYDSFPPGFVGHRLFGCSSFASKASSFFYKNKGVFNYFDFFPPPAHDRKFVWSLSLTRCFFVEGNSVNRLSHRVLPRGTAPASHVFHFRFVPLLLPSSLSFTPILCSIRLPWSESNLGQVGGTTHKFFFLFSHNLQLNFGLQLNTSPGFHNMKSISSRSEIF